jgi:hypothetical protein
MKTASKTEGIFHQIGEGDMRGMNIDIHPNDRVMILDDPDEQSDPKEVRRLLTLWAEVDLTG